MSYTGNPNITAKRDTIQYDKPKLPWGAGMAQW